MKIPLPALCLGIMVILAPATARAAQPATLPKLTAAALG
jgi:hypothetical protein